MKTCDIPTTGYGIRCGNDARFFVTYFVDGSNGKYTCAQHVAKAVNIVLDTPPADSHGTAKVVRLPH